ncbi:MAG TPA: hypothetical protein VGD26_08540 [Chitinophagaceae bacterium]
MKRAYNYFELKRNVIYKCNLDSASYDGKFEYKLHKHFLVYRPTYGDEKKWSGVWNSNWYNDTKASYMPTRKRK